MATVQRKLVHKQFNSPIGLYSENNLKSTLNRELKAFSNGKMGIECDDNARPDHLANSAVLKLLEEEERQKQAGGIKRVTWPPEHEYQARASSQTRQSPAYQSQHRQPSPHPHYQNGSNPSGHQYHQQSVPQTVHYPEQSYQQSPTSYPQSGHQHQQHQQSAYQQQQHHQPVYHQGEQSGRVEPSQQQQAYQHQIFNKYQYPSAQDFNSPDPTYMKQSTPSYLQSQQQTIKQPSCTTAFTGGISVGNKAQSQAANNPSNWSHVQSSRPVHSGYVQPQYSQQPPFHNPNESTSPYAVNQNQYQHQQQQTYQQQQYKQQQQHQQQQHYHQQQSTPVQLSTQYQTNQSVQPQPQKQYHPEDNFYRQPSPGVITLRRELPVTQQPPLVYASEPAAQSFRGGASMRGDGQWKKNAGDQKWPPEEYKKQSEIENEQRRQLALGPAFRPRRVNKDYTPFFQRHALNSTFPHYRAPPGTQHYSADPYPQYPQY